MSLFPCLICKLNFPIGSWRSSTEHMGSWTTSSLPRLLESWIISSVEGQGRVLAVLTGTDTVQRGTSGTQIHAFTIAFGGGPGHTGLFLRMRCKIIRLGNLFLKVLALLCRLSGFPEQLASVLGMCQRNPLQRPQKG